MPNIADIQKRHGKWVDTMVATFSDHLRSIMTKALAKMAADLQAKLSITDGKVDRTPANIRTLKSLEARFMEQLNASGFQTLVRAFTAEFAQQNAFAQQVLRVAKTNIKRKKK